MLRTYATESNMLNVRRNLSVKSPVLEELKIIFSTNLLSNYPVSAFMEFIVLWRGERSDK